MTDRAERAWRDPAPSEPLAARLASGSAIARYRSTHVGERSLWRLLRYELLASLLGPIPGAGGLFLRRLLWPRLFARVGARTVFGPRITLRCPGRIALGKSVIVDEDAVLDAKGEAGAIEVGDTVLVGKATVLSTAAATITLGNQVSIGPFCHLRASHAPLAIGSFVTIGGHSTVITGNPDHTRLDVPMMKQRGASRGVTIGDDVWIGVGVRVVDGARIGSGAVIGAGAVVLGEIPERTIAAGVPARPIRRRGEDGPPAG